MRKDQIEHLYKFRSLSGQSREWVTKIFLENQIKFSNPEELNDPFDCRPDVTFKAPPDELKNHFDNLFKEKAPLMPRRERRQKVNAAVREVIRGGGRGPAADKFMQRMLTSGRFPGVFSLCQEWDHVLMWSHYADSHAGICLRFEASSEDSYFGRAQRIVYQEDRPEANIVKDDEWTFARKCLLTKASSWAYEKEWRIVDFEQGPGVHGFPVECLDGVILGCMMTEPNRQFILDLVARSGRNIEVMQAVCVKKGGFKLKLSKI